VSSSSLSNKNSRSVSLLGTLSDADRPLRDRPEGAAASTPPGPAVVPEVRIVLAGLADDQAVLTVRGEVDFKSAPQLDVLFDAVTASAYPSVVLDPTGMDSIDPAGLTVIVTAASSLIASGDQLTIRSSLSEIARVLDSSWLAGLISLELPGPSLERLGPEQAIPDSAISLRVALPDVAQHLSRAKVVPANDGAIDGALRLAVALARTMVDGTDGASVTLRRDGRLGTVAASDQTVSDMDANQYATGEGPCVDAAIEGRRFHAQSLEEETRWPAFTPRARALGISAILSSPLLAEGQPVGALNIYSRTAAAFGAKEQELASVFATEASNILSDAGVQMNDDQMTGRFEGALRTREIIAETQGVIIERQDVGEDDAFDILRRFSQRSGRPLSRAGRGRDGLGSAVLAGSRPSHERSP
jgi:anti-anti-sigma factor